MGPYLRLLRPGNSLIGLVGTVVGGYAVYGFSALEGWRPLLILALAGLTTFLVTGAGNVLNDYSDREEDKVNHPERPLASGAVDAASGKRYCGVLFVLSPFPLLLAEFLGPPGGGLAAEALPLGLWALAVVLLLSYESYSKARGLAGNATVAFLTGEVFLFGAAVVGRPLSALAFTGMAALATLSREVIKDMEDREGDQSRQTLPRTHGLRLSSRVAWVSVALAVALSPVPLLTLLAFGSGAFIIYLVLVLASDAVFVGSVVGLPGRLHEGQTLSKWAMVLALGAFLGAAFR